MKAFLSVISDSEQQWKKQQKVSVCAMGDVKVALNFKSIPNSTLKEKTPPTGRGVVKLIHIELFYVTFYLFQWCHVTFSSIFKNFGP